MLSVAIRRKDGARGGADIYVVVKEMIAARSSKVACTRQRAYSATVKFQRQEGLISDNFCRITISWRLRSLIVNVSFDCWDSKHSEFLFATWDLWTFPDRTCIWWISNYYKPWFDTCIYTIYVCKYSHIYKCRVHSLSRLFPDWLMIAFITWNSNLVPLLEGLCASNPCRFEFSGFWVFAGIEPTTSGLTVPRSDQLS